MMSSYQQAAWESNCLFSSSLLNKEKSSSCGVAAGFHGGMGAPLAQRSFRRHHLILDQSPLIWHPFLIRGWLAVLAACGLTMHGQTAVSVFLPKEPAAVPAVLGALLGQQHAGCNLIMRLSLKKRVSFCPCENKDMSVSPAITAQAT